MSGAIILAVDPGKSGAIAAIDRDGNLHDTWDMPVVDKRISAPLLADILVPLQPVTDVLVCEDVHAMPGQGVTSMFTFGRGLGVVEGVALGAGIPVRWVSPARWKRALGLSADKGASRRRATELWPSQSSMFARVKDDGRSEAALIAYYWLHFGERADR